MYTQTNINSVHVYVLFICSYVCLHLFLSAIQCCIYIFFLLWCILGTLFYFYSLLLPYYCRKFSVIQLIKKCWPYRPVGLSEMHSGTELQASFCNADLLHWHDFMFVMRNNSSCKLHFLIDG